jgi:paraquat-inducible protein A
MDYTNSMNELTACHECDLLVRRNHGAAGTQALCPRCGCVLHKPVSESINKSLAMSMTGLILYIPANFLPIMTLEMIGLSNSNTMIKGVIQLFQGGYWWMSLLVFMCSMVVPLIQLILLFCICLFVKFGWYSALLIKMTRALSHINEWAMLDVYMLGILVAFVKMMDMGDLIVGTGMFCYISLLVTAVYATSSFDAHLIWEEMEKKR